MPPEPVRVQSLQLLLLWLVLENYYGDGLIAQCGVNADGTGCEDGWGFQREKCETNAALHAALVERRMGEVS